MANIVLPIFSLPTTTTNLCLNIGVPVKPSAPSISGIPYFAIGINLDLTSRSNVSAVSKLSTQIILSDIASDSLSFNSETACPVYDNQSSNPV